MKLGPRHRRLVNQACGAYRARGWGSGVGAEDSANPAAKEHCSVGYLLQLSEGRRER